jgi:thiamine biosynthesis lipoprotein
MSDRQRLRARFLASWLLCLLVTACDWGEESHEVTPLLGSVMGTHYLVKVVDMPEGLTLVNLDEEVSRLLKDIDASMSTYRSDSELSRFNTADTTEWFPVSADMIEVIDHALQVSETSRGAFDITVGPLVNLWGFGPDLQADRVPTDQQIQSEMARVGYQRVHIRRQPPALRKDLETVYVDLSAVAKGYAVDRVADHLEQLGITNYMVEVGGELRLKGHNERGTPWQIAVEEPSTGERKIYGIMQLDNQGVATSGDYRNYFEIDGQHYSHTIDPRTGRSVDHDLASVTVIARTSMHADAMATALLVAGPDAGLKLAQQQGIAAYFIIKSDDGFTATATEPFQEYLLPDE